MPSSALSPLLLLLAAPALLGQGDAVPDGTQFAQLTIRHIVIRIPRMLQSRAAPTPNATPIRWAEKKAPKCVPVQAMAGASLVKDGSIDLMTTDGGRLRARLDDDCPPIDYYSGFYMKATQDGMVCAGRDSIRSRSGGSCPITGFKRLVAKR